METIVNIKETTFAPADTMPVLGGCDGFVITTDSQEIKLGITTDQQCCEEWGYFMTQDDLSGFVGADLIDVSVTDKTLVNHDLRDHFVGQAMFVNVQTSRGLLQFVAYNEHNGYYGHMACVLSNQINHSELL